MRSTLCKRVKQTLLASVVVVVVAALGVALLAGGSIAHDDGDGLTVHNQTQPLDQHSEVHTITVDKATADTDFYVDVHTDNGTINKTATFEAGTLKENLELVLDPTITSETEVTIATHAANGTEIASETITVSVVEAPNVSFSNQVRELDKHEEVHTITVDTVSANHDYYVDVHTEQGTINKTRTFEGGTAQTNLTLTLEPTLTSTSDVTVAVHATNGTELAADTATITTADVQFSNQTRKLDEHNEVHTITVEQVSAGKAFYVDVHTDEGTINKTATFEAGTTKEDLELVLDPTLKSATEVTVAVHAVDGTELAASTATVHVTDGSEDKQTETTTTNKSESPMTEADSGGSSPTEQSTSGDTPGFGLIGTLVALVGAVFVGQRFRNSDKR